MGTESGLESLVRLLFRYMNWYLVLISGSYATAPEIHKYLLDTSYKYDLRQYVRFQHRVLDAHWDEETGMWNLRIEDEISGEVLSDSCHFLFNGGGYLK